MSKIGAGGLAAALILSRVFSEVMLMPGQFAGYQMERFSVILFGKLAVCIAYIPLLIMAVKLPKANVIGILNGKSKTAGWIIGIIYTVFFWGDAIMSAANFNFYTSSTLYKSASSIVLITPLILVCLFGTIKGIEAISRTGWLVFWFFILFLLLVIMSIGGRINLSFLYPSFFGNDNEYMKSILSEFSSNNEMIVFAMLLSRTKSKPSKVLYWYLPAAFVIMEVLTFLKTTVLGPYLNVTSYPYYTLSSLCDITLFERLDGIDAIIWILTAVIKISLDIICVRVIFTEIAGKKTASVITYVSAAAVLCGAITTSSDVGITDVFRKGIDSGIPLLVLGTAIPLIALIVGLCGKNKTAVDCGESEAQ